jgi:HEAT repeat protein
MKEFKRLIEKGLTSEASFVLVEIKDANGQIDIPYLLELLMETESGILRNEIALILSDYNVEEVVSLIIELLQSPKTIGYRGSLVGALEPFDYKPYSKLLLELMLNDNYEVRRRSFTLLEPILEELSESEKDHFTKSINSKIEDLEEDIEILEDVIDLLGKV